MDTLGRQVLIDLWDCNPEKLNHLPYLKELFVTAAHQAGAHVREVTFHAFQPIGISGVVIISESHLTVHTYPEHAYASVDLYTCSTKMDPYLAMEYLIKELESKNWDHREIKRGLGKMKINSKVRL